VRSLLPLCLLAACTDVPDPVGDPNAGLLRDFLDGKFDAAGHPLNAKVIDATACGTGCELAIPDGATSGELMVNVRLRVRAHPSRGTIVTLALLDATGGEAARETLTVSRLRGRASWIDVPVASTTAIARLRITPAAGAAIDVDYAEVFPKRFGLAIAPGSGVAGAADRVTFEVPRARKLDKLSADGADLLPRLDELIAQGKATRTTTAFRTLIDASVGDLVPTRGELVELRAATTGDAARVQLRTAVAPCRFEGDPAGARVLVTGFQPFPADGWHDNISGVAVTALDPARLRGAQVMRLVLPVEYDRAAAAIAEVIERCAPAAVLSFGQGGGAIALEEVAYNLQDTGEISGGVPDNRGVIRAAAPIDDTAPATRDTLLPLDEIEAALVALGESPQHSRDPGRYICNNVMFVDLGAMASRGRAGFIHLPYTTQFDDAVRARFARVVEAAVQATVDTI
jgi:pyroglutamyl-peptidase